MRCFCSALAVFVLVPGLALAQVTPSHSAVEGQLCRSQLELLKSGDKLMPDEVERFEAQCDCLEKRAESGSDVECAEGEQG